MLELNAGGIGDIDELWQLTSRRLRGLDKKDDRKATPGRQLYLEL